MTLALPHAAAPARPRSRGLALVDRLVPFWIACGAVVITEPSPYELAFLVVLGASLLGGFNLHRGTLGLLGLFGLFIPFAYIAAFQVRFNGLTESLIYQSVTIFLFFTAYWVANYVADAPHERMKRIMAAYIAAASVSALLGIMGYLGIAHELLTRYDRAKALFNDPNVFAPFLILPATVTLTRLLMGTRREFWLWGAVYGLLFAGVLVSFSRAAWGHIVISSAMTFVLLFVLEAAKTQRRRMVTLAGAGVVCMALGIGVAFSIPSIRSFIELRTQEQNYDTGDSGRFGRQGYAFDLALTHPLGLGPLEFRNMRVKEEPHDTYVNVLHAYGWGGGAMFIGFILMTMWRGLGALRFPHPNRVLLIPVISVFVPLAGEAAIIDIDHWRHFFLVGGMVWGLTAHLPLRSSQRPR
jgi:hypothetical protein